MHHSATFGTQAGAKSYLCAKLGDLEREVFAVLLLDTKLRLIEYAELFHGTIDSARVYTREVVKAALRVNAAAVVLGHNHPSGDPKPSSEDRKITQQVKDALKLIDVRIVDHLVVGGNGAVSFAERGLI
ncbi:DNA repair protein RadC [Stenotrophomonas sp. 1337]|nr:DNA repair protein RadC [Stenotrophomonas sp. 1337]